MIHLKSPGEIDAMREAGRVSAYALRMVGQAVKAGVSTLELDEIAEEAIREQGGVPAFKGYGGFPASICSSINDQIVHGIPSPETILQSGDIISIDTGAVVDGWVGDNAWTYPVGSVSPEKKHLLEITEKCMWAGVSAARPGNHMGDIGNAIESIAARCRYGVVRNYVGHGIGRNMHEEPNVPNFGKAHTGIELVEGMVLAIEPMVNVGTHKTRTMRDGWLVCTRDGKPSAHFEKTVAITADGPVLLTVEPGRDKPV